MVKVFYNTFGRSIAEYNRKLVINCCQIVYFELMNIYVTEAFAVYELRNRIKDPLLDELVPNLYKKPVKIVVDDELPVNRLLDTDYARLAWVDYVGVTKHSKVFFVEQRERMKSFVNDIHKKTSLFQSRADSLKALGNHNTSEARKLADMDLELHNVLKIFHKKTPEEMILSNKPYSTLMKSSHLSIAMKRFSGSNLIGKGTSISCKAPLTISYRFGSLPIKKSENSANKKEIKKEEKKKTVEQWIKKNVKAKGSQELIDKWYKDIGYKIPENETHNSPLVKKQRNSSISKSDLEEKLKEKPMFNNIFGERINKKVKEMVNKKEAEFKGHTERESVQEKIIIIPENTLIFPEVPIKDPKNASMKKFNKILNKKLVIEKEPKRFDKLDVIVKKLKEANVTARNKARSILFYPH